MKLEDLKPILFSRRGSVQFAIIYDEQTCHDIVSGCSIEYAVKEYGARIVQHIEAFGDQLLITVCNRLTHRPDGEKGNTMKKFFEFIAGSAFMTALVGFIFWGLFLAPVAIR